MTTQPEHVTEQNAVIEPEFIGLKPTGLRIYGWNCFMNIVHFLRCYFGKKRSKEFSIKSCLVLELFQCLGALSNEPYATKHSSVNLPKFTGRIKTFKYSLNISLSAILKSFRQTDLSATNTFSPASNRSN